MKNPIKAYLDLGEELKALKKKQDQIKQALLNALESSETGELVQGKYKAYLTRYNRSQVDSEMVKAVLGKRFSEVVREVSCSSLKVGEV